MLFYSQVIREVRLIVAASGRSPVSITPCTYYGERFPR